jgi:hypothetical protein
LDSEDDESVITQCGENGSAMMNELIGLDFEECVVMDDLEDLAIEQDVEVYMVDIFPDEEVMVMVMSQI